MVQHFKHLGIWLEIKLSYKMHAKSLDQKKSKIFIKKQRLFLLGKTNKQQLKKRAVHDPHAAVTTLEPLDAVYHSAIRFIT